MTLMRWKSVLAISTLPALLIAIPTAGQNKNGSPNPSNLQSVLVINGTGAPVPTAPQGVTNVSGSVSLASGTTVNVGNTPNVNVANTPTVNLAGGAGVSVTNPLNGQNNPTPLAVLEAIQPYEDSCQMNFPDVTSATCDFQVVPAGKRLVIEEFDARGRLATGLFPIQIHLRHFGPDHFFPATFMGSSLGDHYTTHQPTRLYIGSSQTPSCEVFLSGSAADGGVYTCNISGFLVDVP